MPNLKKRMTYFRSIENALSMLSICSPCARCFTSSAKRFRRDARATSMRAKFGSVCGHMHARCLYVVTTPAPLLETLHRRCTHSAPIRSTCCMWQTKTAAFLFQSSSIRRFGASAKLRRSANSKVKQLGES